MNTRIIFFVAAVVLLAGCFKEVSYKTTYVIKPLVEQTSGDQIVVQDGVLAYAYGVDTTDWTVASYEDAVQGILSSKMSPVERITEPVATASPYEEEGSEGLLQLKLSNPSMMVLVVDTKNKIYGYTQQQLGVNLPALYVTLIFRPWKSGRSYKEGNWSFYNQFYVPASVVKFYITPKVQSAEEGAEEELALGKAYAYAVDTTLWRIASYDDAFAGIITSKNDATVQRTTPTYTGNKESSGSYMMSVSTPQLMVVMVDRVNRIYAYTSQTVDLLGDPLNVPIVFRPWRHEYLYVDQGWRVVNDKYIPVAPEKPDPETLQTPESKFVR